MGERGEVWLEGEAGKVPPSLQAICVLATHSKMQWLTATVT